MIEGEDSLDWTPQRLLQAALNDLNHPNLAEQEFPFNRPPDKLLIIGLWDEEGYGTRFYNAGMKMSECMALCSYMEKRFYDLVNENSA